MVSKQKRLIIVFVQRSPQSNEPQEKAFLRRSATMRRDGSQLDSAKASAFRRNIAMRGMPCFTLAFAEQSELSAPRAANSEDAVTDGTKAPIYKT